MWKPLEEIIARIIADIAEFLKKHIFRSIGTTVAFTIALLLFLLNPWFGSTAVKALIFKYMTVNEDEVYHVMDALKDDKKFSPVLEAGARRAGFYGGSDKLIIEKWSGDWAKIDPQKGEVNLPTDLAAIKDARDRARKWAPPFQPGGFQLIISMPACRTERPALNTFDVNRGSMIPQVAALRQGDKVRIQRVDAKGGYVVATVRLRDLRAEDKTDGWLNFYQYDQMLGLSGTSGRVIVVPTDEDVNQPTFDNEPDREGCPTSFRRR